MQATSRRGPSKRPLTEHQLTALQLAAGGATQAAIGRSLGIDGKSVGKLMTEVFRKLGAVNMPNAVFLACHAGYLDGRRRTHGDHAGYEAHRRRGEDPKLCRLGCPEGEAEHRKRYPKSRKAPESP
ncbi:LuxR C-terminal-related transcriptional regulator [Streptomyces sp. NPDC051582]|uniref:LuxR C-terminal-related transcriptional regulator n=1 Tax=Streptomyces sp. NPDC051582 TaxID=3155167 RepID=UPI00341B0F31